MFNNYYYLIRKINEVKIAYIGLVETEALMIGLSDQPGVQCLSDVEILDEKQNFDDKTNKTKKKISVQWLVSLENSDCLQLYRLFIIL